MSYPNAFIGYPVNPEPPGFPLKTCGNDISRAIKQVMQISNQTTLTIYNFLQYSERQWSPFSPTLHYQNRLRHRDYLDLFYEAGFEIVDELLQKGSADDLKTIEQLSLDKRFKSYTTAELAISSAHIILKRMPPERPRYHRVSGQ
ncbi:MAG: hypothetical protein E3K36_00380 [Candidatus Brocadia sp.]|nr:hypothetical protein [Candidatus Brocadia sp.]